MQNRRGNHTSGNGHSSRGIDGGSLSYILDALPDAIVISNERGFIVEINRASEELFGYDRHELLGRTVEILLPPQFRDRHASLRSDYFLHPKSRPLGCDIELSGKRKDGSEFPADISLGPIQLGSDTYAVAAIRDISDRKRIEEALQQATEMKNAFLASVSHELRTPLNSIIGFSEFLRDERAGPLQVRQREYVEDILQSGRRLLNLINCVIDLSKIESGIMTVFPEQFLFETAIDEARAAIDPIVQEKHLAIEVLIEPQVSSVTLDFVKVRQVLFYLLSTTAAFAPAGDTVTIAVNSLKSSSIQIEIRNRGAGIAKEDLDQIFSDGTHLDAAIARKYPGTALSLTLVKKIVGLLEGSVVARCEAGVGTTFIVRLPSTLHKGQPIQ